MITNIQMEISNFATFSLFKIMIVGGYHGRIDEKMGISSDVWYFMDPLSGEFSARQAQREVVKENLDFFLLGLKYTLRTCFESTCTSSPVENIQILLYHFPLSFSD